MDELTSRVRDPRIGWSDFELLSHIAAAGSFRGAIERSGLALNTLRTRVERLETIVGRPLLQRSVAGVAPTEAGIFLLGISTAMANAKDDALNTVIDVQRVA